MPDFLPDHKANTFREMKEYPFLDMRRLTAPYAEEMGEACSRVIASGRFLHGPETEAFERELAESCGTAHCVATSNGLDALRLCLRAWVETGRMRPGDEVIVAANTYVASVLAITDTGLVPVLVEPDEETMNIDPERAESAIGPRTRAIMEVHLYGTPARHSLLRETAARHGLLIIEDNAQAIGATTADGLRVTGSLGDAAAFSFYPTKNIGALGDAGAVTTGDADLAAAVRAIANYGSDRRYHNIYAGLNSRLDPVQAAVLKVKLPHLEEENALRRRNAAVYDREISNPAITKPLFADDLSSVWHQYVVRTDNRDLFRQYLSENGVESDVLYPTAPFDQPCYAGRYNTDCPIARRIAETVVSLPVSRCTTPGDASEIAAIINAYNPIKA